MSHIPTDFDRIIFPSSYLFPGVIALACFTLLEWGVHINGIFAMEIVSLAPLLPRKFSLLVNMYEKFVLACLSRHISG